MQTQFHFKMLSRPESYHNKVIVLNGWEATGKTGLANIIRHLRGCPPFRYLYQLEWYLYLALAKQIDDNTLSTLVKSEIDLASYNLCYGRETNIRLTDQSSVLSHPDFWNYLKRSFSKKVDERSIDQSLLYLLTHNLAPCFKQLHDILGLRLKYIEIMRDPLCMIDQVLYNYHNLYSKPVPRNFTLANQQTKLPCFCLNNDELKFASSPWDFAIKQIDLCYSYSYEAFSKTNGYDYLLIFFEDLTVNPYKYIADIESYMGIKFRPSVHRALKIEKMPRDKIWNSRILPIYEKIGMSDIGVYEQVNTVGELKSDYDAYISKYRNDGMSGIEVERLLECRERYLSFKVSTKTRTD